MKLSVNCHLSTNTYFLILNHYITIKNSPLESASTVLQPHPQSIILLFDFQLKLITSFIKVSKLLKDNKLNSIQ